MRFDAEPSQHTDVEIDKGLPMPVSLVFGTSAGQQDGQIAETMGRGVAQVAREQHLRRIDRLRS